MSLILSGTDGLSDVDGTAATPAIRGTDTNTGIFFPAADTIAFSEGGVEAARFDSSGNLGLGVTPSAWDTVVPAFQIGGAGGYIAAQGSAEVLRIGSNNYYNSSAFRYVINGAASRYDQSGGAHSWHTAASGTAGNTISFTQAMTLDSSGNLGVGATSPAARLEVSKSENGETGAIIRNATNGSNAGALLKFIAGTDFGQIIRFPASHGAKANQLYITNVGATSPITFATQDTERVRIDSSGNLLVGTTSTTVNPGVVVYGGISNAQIQIGHGNGVSSGEGYMGFQYNGSAIGSITQSGTTAVAYNTSSDYRLKNTIVPMTGVLAKVALLKPCTYKWNADGSDGEGFIAHELAEVCPSAVTGEKDALDADGNIKPQGIDTSFLVATLTAAIQEQQALITQLTARITALETPAVTP